MKNLFLISAIVIVLLYVPENGFTQNIDLAIDIEQIDGSNQNLSDLKNTEFMYKTILIQLGDENSAFIKQVGLNTITAKQVGIQNSIKLIQSGFESQITLYQNGQLNHYFGELNGSNIEALITQNGSLNTIKQHVSSDHLLYEMIQEGKGNTITQTANSIHSPNLKIQQRGNNMQLIIRSN